ncbi:MAG: NUDIX hydrolase [Cyclobacteriaceae bacterium]
MTLQEKVLNYVKSVKAAADTGLVYAENPYDKDRYEQLLESTLEILAELDDTPIDKVRNFYRDIDDYPTPNVDVRGLLINDSGEILMVQEKVDSKWTIPGGWADIGLSPTENIIKEIKEETGLDAKVIRLLAVWDKKMHPHPPQPHYVYKLVYLCEATGGTLQKAFDTLDAKWIDPTNLPPLSEDRILEHQLKKAIELAHSTSNEVDLD